MAKTTQNPVGDIVSVPFQFNFNGGGGLKDATLFNLNLQPVIPIHLTPKVSLIARTIIPVNSMPGPNGTQYSGTGDIQQELLFTPGKPKGIIWALGPTFSLPTATAKPAQTGTWAAGGSALILKMTGPWVLGAIAAQFSPLHDSNGSPRTNLFTMQPIVNYNFGKGWALTSSPIYVANWDSAAGQKWTIPVGGGISRTLVFNRQPMTLGMQYYYNAKRPDGGPTTLLRFVLVLIYPNKSPK
ncbi:MAG: hypothetical protein HY821_24640 [Acidobacteria bacterium]|nr:hypothetical protein [Acidobacteriota bacterium]